MRKIFLLLLLGNLLAQATTNDSGSIFPSSESVLDSLTQSYAKIEDYYVQIELSIKTPMLRMPRKKVDFWYKTPNLTKAKAKGFAAIPKSGLISSPVDLFDNLTDISVIVAEYYKESQVWILQGILHPDSLTFKNIDDYSTQVDLQMRLFVDRENWILLRSETWLDTVQILEIESDYLNVKDDIYLPKETVIKFEYSKDLTSDLEKSFHSNNQMANMKKDMVIGSDTAKDIKEKTISGLITLKFSKYKVNEGLEDSFFIEEKEE